LIEGYPSIADYEMKAAERFTEPDRDLLISRKGDKLWVTNEENLRGFERFTVRRSVLNGVTTRNLETTILGAATSLPVILGPSGAHQHVHPDGEIATARAAERAGTIMVLSTNSNFSIEEVADAGRSPLWFQLYVLKDRSITENLVTRAAAAGFTAIVLTADNITGRYTSGLRRSSVNSYMAPDRYMKNFDFLPLGRRPASLVDNLDQTLSWADLEWLKGLSGLKLIIKGIQTCEDARRCVDHGADALVVSNHGGTAPEMERMPASIDCLPDVVASVGREIEVYVDGGVRLGHDVLKALALGARSVMIGRPVQWGLAVNGEDGVVEIIDILRRELDSVMAQCGVADVRDVSRSVIQARLPS
jgi:4-hydroxymandelate oxidase